MNKKFFKTYYETDTLPDLKVEQIGLIIEISKKF